MLGLALSRAKLRSYFPKLNPLVLDNELFYGKKKLY